MFLDSSSGSDFFTVGLDGGVIFRSLHYNENNSPTRIWKTVADRSSKNGSKNETKNTSETRNNSGTVDKSLLNEDEFIGNDKQPVIRFPASTKPKALEIAFSEMTPNMILLQAHRFDND